MVKAVPGREWIVKIAEKSWSGWRKSRLFKYGGIILIKSKDEDRRWQCRIEGEWMISRYSAGSFWYLRPIRFDLERFKPMTGRAPAFASIHISIFFNPVKEAC